ncbi:RES family NAD+ phosphorylase [Pseudomonas putida]
MEEQVCWKCIGDSILVREIKEKGKASECSYCAEMRKCLSTNWLTQRVRSVLRWLIKQGDMEPEFDSEGDISHYEQRGDSLSFWVTDVLGVDDESSSIIEAVCDGLQPNFRDITNGEESEFPTDASYVRRKHRPVRVEVRWQSFKKDILHGRRFFNDTAKPFLDWLFSDAETLGSYTSHRGNQNVVKTLDTGTFFYRARRCDSWSAVQRVLKDAESRLGPPPHEVAKAGRMNPAGVPFFYGAFDRSTCVAELRPPVGGKVVSGKFMLTRPLRVFDFASLDEIYTRGAISYFDDNYLDESHRKAFLRRLHTTISYPVLPDDENEYVVTQVIAEYLLSQFPSGLDGVIFQSAQRREEGARNIVIFTGALPAIDFQPSSVQVHELEAVNYRDKVRNVVNGEMMLDAEDYESEWDFEPIMDFDEDEA